MKSRLNQRARIARARARQQGFSLMEMGLGITVVAVLMIGTLLMLEKVQLDRRLQKARQDVPASIQAISMSATLQYSTNWVSTKAMSMMDVWAKHRMTDPGKDTVKIQGHFPGSYEYVFPNAYGMNTVRTANTGFMYWITNVPAEACLPMLQMMAAQSQVVGLLVAPNTVNPAATNGAAVAVTAAADTNSVIRLNMPVAVTQCGKDSNDKTLVAYIARA